MLTPIILILCSVLLGFSLCIVLTAVVTRSRAAQRKTEREAILALQDKISNALQDNIPETGTTFNRVLSQATLNSGFLATGMQVHVKTHRDPPEKYKILQRLASQGMGSEEVAAILGISTVEADQLINLHKVADCHS